MATAAAEYTASWHAPSSRVRPAALAHRASPAGHVLDSVAGFFGSATEARGAMRQLSAKHALPPAQMLLLAPDNASWFLFTLRSRRWADRARLDSQAWFGDAWFVASAGALLAALMSVTQLSLQDAMAVDLAVLAFALSTLGGAAGGAGLAWLSRRLPHLEAFSTSVRQQLARGRWALVVHGVPWERQAASVALLRECGIDWCAVSVVQRTL